MAIGGRVRSPPTRRRKQQSEMKRSRGGRAGKLSGEDGRKEKTVETERSVGHRWKTRARGTRATFLFLLREREAESGRIGSARERERGTRQVSSAVRHARCSFAAMHRQCVHMPSSGRRRGRRRDGHAVAVVGTKFTRTRIGASERERKRDRERQRETDGSVRPSTACHINECVVVVSPPKRRGNTAAILSSTSLLLSPSRRTLLSKSDHAAFVNSRGFPGRLTTTTTTTTTTGRG